MRYIIYCGVSYYYKFNSKLPHSLRYKPEQAGNIPYGFLNPKSGRLQEASGYIYENSNRLTQQAGIVAICLLLSSVVAACGNEAIPTPTITPPVPTATPSITVIPKPIPYHQMHHIEAKPGETTEATAGFLSVVVINNDGTCEYGIESEDNDVAVQPREDPANPNKRILPDTSTTQKDEEDPEGDTDGRSSSYLKYKINTDAGQINATVNLNGNPVFDEGSRSSRGTKNVVCTIDWDEYFLQLIANNKKSK